MNGAKGSALEWALALLRAPGERHVLRQRPLPQDGMELLLDIAARATPEVLAEQARRFGEGEAQVLEAARFYVREVLFHPQADAYRTLGVEARASDEKIKTHYRLLQLWLHPDRAHSEDDAVFAARVNSAWNRLRTPERRQAYDEALRVERSPEVFDSSGALRGVRTWVPAAEPLAPPSPWRRRFPALALLALCGVLALLALRDMSRADSDWEAPPRTVASASTADAEPIAPLILPAATGTLPAEAITPHSAPVAKSTMGKASAESRQTALDPESSMQPQADAATRGFVVDRRTDVDASGSKVHTGRDTAAPGRAPIPPVRVEAASAVQVATAHPVDAVRAPAPAAVVASPPAAAALQGEFARVQSARLAGEQLLDFLRTPRSAAPPIWSSPAVEADTQQLRQRLHADGRPRLADARWRIGRDEAVLEAAVTVPGGGVSNRQVIAHLRWRDGYWLVTRAEMESTR